MPVFNYGEIFSSLFTWLKLGISTALLVILMGKLIETWEDTQTSIDQQQQTEDIIRY